MHHASLSFYLSYPFDSSENFSIAILKMRPPVLWWWLTVCCWLSSSLAALSASSSAFFLAMAAAIEASLAAASCTDWGSTTGENETSTSKNYNIQRNNKSKSFADWGTSPGLTTPTDGDIASGSPGGMQNSKILGPLEGANPLMTALFIRDKRGLATRMWAMDDELMGVAANDIDEWESSKAGNAPIPLQCIL